MHERPIVKATDADRHENDDFGITYEVLSVGPTSMVTKMLYEDGDRVPEHSHESEQSGFVVSGRIRLVFESHDEVLEAGDGYTIPGNVTHQIDVLEPGEVIDVFTPLRADLL